MKIVNICLGGSYNIGWGYQDNLITKYQVKNGNESTIITTSYINDKNSEKYLLTKPGIFYDNGVKIIRLKHKLFDIISKYFRTYKGLYKELENEKPEFIFIHCCQFLDIFQICKYLNKHPNIKCCVDNHADGMNSAKSPFSFLIHKTLWKTCAKQIDKYAQVFYGVTKARCDFLNEMYNISKNKIELLVLGADDDQVLISKQNRKKTRQSLKINDNDFLVVTGGKIDSNKKEVINLLRACSRMNNNVKLVVFGSVTDEMKESFNQYLCDSIYMGWINQEQIYDVLCAADLCVYPGLHSVLWEQTVGCGIPAVFKKLPNTNHIDVGGNCIISKDMSEDYLYNTILNLANNKEQYDMMKLIAQNKGAQVFSYRDIARRSLDEVIK